MNRFFSISAAAFAGCIASAQQPQLLPAKPTILPRGISGVRRTDQQPPLSPAELASRALEKKKMEEAVDYLHNSLKRAKAALAEMNDCKTDFVEMAPKLAEVLPLPSGTLAYIEPPDGWFMAIEDLISAFTKMPIERGHSTSEEFSTARRQFVDACLIHYEDLRKAAKPETVADAKDEQEASLKAYLSLPKEILTLPESFERPFPLDAKNPELRQAFRRIDTAKRAAYYSERGHQYATAEIGKAPPRLAAVFRKLYAEPPVAVGELDQLLLKHGLEKSPLANAIRGEQAG